jgi:hypothetical protein
MKEANHLLEVARFHHCYIRGPIQITGSKDRMKNLHIVDLGRCTPADREIVKPQEFADNTRLTVVQYGETYKPRPLRAKKLTPVPVHQIVKSFDPPVKKKRECSSLYAGSIAIRK